MKFQFRQINESILDCTFNQHNDEWIIVMYNNNYTIVRFENLLFLEVPTDAQLKPLRLFKYPER